MPTRTSLLAALGVMSLLSAAPGATAAPAADRYPTPDGSDLLAEGPLPVTVSRANPRTKFVDSETGELLFLTRDALYYRSPKANMLPVVCPAADGTAPQVTATLPGTGGAVRTVTWKIDAAKREYAGEALPPRPATPPAAAATPKDVNVFLFHALERLEFRAEGAVSAGDRKLTDLLSARATELANYTRRNGHDPAVARAFADLPDYITARQAASDEIAAALDAAKKKNAELFAQAKAAQARAQAAAMMGFAQMFMGAMPVEVGRQYYTDGSYTSITDNYDNGMIASGLTGLMTAGMNHQRELASLQLAKQVCDERTARRCADLQSQIERNRQSRRDGTRKIGADRFGISADNPLDKSFELRTKAAATRDFAPVLAVMEDRARRDRGTGTRDNPFAVVDLLMDRAAAARLAKAKPTAVFALAEQAAAAAGLVPPGDEFAFERFDVLSGAAALASLAAADGAFYGDWAKAYSPYAGYAARLLGVPDLATLDPSGEAREQRAVALMLCGRPTESLQLALEIEPLRKDSAGYQMSLARLMCSNPKRTKRDLEVAMDHLELAVKLGYRDIARLKTGGEFQDFRILKARFDEITRLDVSKALGWGEKGVNIAVTNNSKYPLTNVALRAEVSAIVRGRRVTRPDELKDPIPSLAPGQTYRWEVPFDGPRQFGNPPPAVVVAMKSDQGAVPNVPAAGATRR